MDPTIRGTGTTATERSLAKLADKTFLDLWSYLNTFNDRDLSNGQGKELCDLLVVCGNDILIFSDKNIRWPSGTIDLAWRRWYRRAVQHSVDQIKGAERWLRRYPDRVFIDPACRTRLPVRLPDPKDLRVHGIAVVSGAREACRSYMNDRDGGLMLTGHLRGDEHLDPTKRGLHPFIVGDANPNGAFVHVMDMDALTVVMRELDTISDFVAYIRERADAIRDRRVSMAASEADLLAAYLLSDAPEGRPFIPNIVDLAHPFELGTASDKSCRSTCRLRTAENSQSLPDRDHICGCEWTAGLDLQIQRRERQQCRRLRKQQLVIPEGRLPTRSFRRLQTISRHSVAGA